MSARDNNDWQSEPSQWQAREAKADKAVEAGVKVAGVGCMIVAGALVAVAIVVMVCIGLFTYYFYK